MYHHNVGCFVHTFSLSRSMGWYACHACLCHPLAFYASLDACLHVHAWVLLASVLSMLQHNEVMDIWSKPTFVPHRHHLLFAFLLVCLLTCLLVCLLSYFFACLPFLFHLFLPLLVYWFLVFAFACIHMERGCVEAGHSLPGESKKGKDASMSI